MALKAAKRRFSKIIKCYKSEISTIYFLAILSGLIQLTLPIGIQSIVGFSLGATMVTSIYVLIFLVVLGVIAVGVLQMSQMKIIEKIQQHLFTNNAIDLSEKIPNLDLYAYNNYYLPEKVNRFFETFSVQKGLSKILLDIPIASIQIIFGLILLSLYHPLFISFGFLLLVVFGLILVLTGSYGIKTSIEESNSKYNTIAWIEEMARVVMSLKFSQGSHLNLKKTDEYVSVYLKNRNKHFNILIIQYKTLIVFKTIITAAMLLVGAYLLVEQKINIGEFVAAEIVLLTIIGAIEKLITSLDMIYDVATGLEKIDSLLEAENEQSGKINLEKTNNAPSLLLNNFSFTYPNGNMAISNLNLEIVPSSINIISGKDGDGKSTLLKVLSTQYSAYEGELLLNNINFKNYSYQSLRNNTGVYIQNQELFNASLFENITMGRNQVSEETVLELIRKLKLNELLNYFRDGFETTIDPAGMKLSSNIINKILLLRALIHKPNLILLDEPFLYLNSSEKTIFIEYLFQISNSATIVIATNDDCWNKYTYNKLTLNN